MIVRLAELNRLLVAVRDLAGPRQKVSVAAVVRNCASTAIGGLLPDHNETLDFARNIGFVQRRGRFVAISESGATFLSLNPRSSYELTDAQCRLLIRTVYLSGVFRPVVLDTLKKFMPAFDRGTFRWSSTESLPFSADSEYVVSQLRELGVVTLLRDDVLEIAPIYVEATAALLAEKKEWTQESLEEFIRERNEIGDVAEELALMYERNRLAIAGHEVEARCVRKISKLRMDAGYDIESFHGASPGLRYDRFIEVKGSRGPEVRFIWSENEIKAARNLGTRYWIYFQGGVDSKKQTAKNRILAFRDPIVTILGDSRFAKSQHGIIVQARMRGQVAQVQPS